ncbi:hypothetical protein CRUP_017390 [Coryphaenoides rupestris]|nr:hypothetical protein CRUP_017390 [Coryphaenoides rupestris]
MQQRMAGAPPPSMAVNTRQQYQSMQVPVEVLKVQTHLENPTDYHIRQSQRQQVKEYLSTTYATKQPVMSCSVRMHGECRGGGAGAEADPPGGTREGGGEGCTTPATAWTRQQVKEYLSTTYATKQMDEVIDDIISMQSSYDDVQGYIDPIQMPNTRIVHGERVLRVHGRTVMCL